MRWIYLGRNLTYEYMNACYVSESVIHQVLNASDGVFKIIKRFNGISDKSCVITSKRLGH